MSQNISFLLAIITLLAIISCNERKIKEVEDDQEHSMSPQEKFARKLAANHIIMRDSVLDIIEVIKEITYNSRYKNQFQVNGKFDSSLLNFYLLDSKRDTSLRNVCAYSGNNSIFLDVRFLHGYLNGLEFFQNITKQKLADFYPYFQFWVISHEVAHAELGHAEGHFINYVKPKTQEWAKQFHGLEFDADQKSISYAADMDKAVYTDMLINVFNSDYSRLYNGVEKTTHKLKFTYDEGTTYPYKLDGSHPSMTIRSAIIIYLLNDNRPIREEAYTFLIESQLHYILTMTTISKANSLSGKGQFSK